MNTTYSFVIDLYREDSKNQCPLGYQSSNSCDLLQPPGCVILTVPVEVEVTVAVDLTVVVEVEHGSPTATELAFEPLTTGNADVELLGVATNEQLYAADEQSE